MTRRQELPGDAGARGLDAIRGAAAADPALLEDAGAFRRAAEGIAGEVRGTGGGHPPEDLVRVLMAARDQLREAGS